MSTQAARSIEIPSPSAAPNWLWTWGGTCFGYRQEASLFTCDGIEVGRFSGAEVYSPEGKYIGELKRAHDCDRLITSSYKKLQLRASFVPIFDRPHPRATDRRAESLYCGYEDFPSPHILKSAVFALKKHLGILPSGNQIN